ncbi:glycoside hydrolase family 16 protein [Ramlibacter humi]|uniref:glycoside hydrolase family 16 protein n=1 Tax=Ramlibacter humi TaxID=2530451 RepID=UPI00142FCE54|nr:glycoside hydrolase family 16 protein [Ramlibacter humi]
MATALQGAAPAASAAWALAYEQSFAGGGALDASFWRQETGLQRNREAQSYQPGNVMVQGGVLRIEARRETVPNPHWRASSGDWRLSRRESSYSSGAIVSRAPLRFARVEIVARTPSGAGVWPALWLVHEAAGEYGEIDLFEAVGKHPDTVFAGVHWGTDPRTRKHRNDSRVVPGFEGRWHTHTLEWTPSAVTISLDGRPWYRFDPDDARLPGGIDPLRRPMHLRINLALGGSWGGDIDDGKLPARFDIASVRVWNWADGDNDAAAAPVRTSPGQPVRPPEPAAEKSDAMPAAPAESAQTRRPPVRWGR